MVGILKKMTIDTNNFWKIMFQKLEQTTKKEWFDYIKKHDKKQKKKRKRK